MIKDILEQLLGAYIPILTNSNFIASEQIDTVNGIITKTYQQSQIVASGMAGVDWVYICSFILLFLLLWVFYKICITTIRVLKANRRY